MRRHAVPTLASLGAVLLFALASATAGPAEAPASKAPAAKAPAVKAAPAATGEIMLKYKAARTWTYDLPAERRTAVSGAFDFTAVGGKRFEAALEGQALAIDTNGDGTKDVKVEGKSGFVQFAVPGDKPFRYAVRLVNQGQGWQYAAGGARVGTLGATRIALLDQNGDGRYDGYGVDAMIVGRSKSACYLSHVVNVAGVLQQIEVAKDGTSLRYRPYTGAAGTLDLASHWETQAKLQSAVVRSEDGVWSFDLARAAAGLKVPAGRYVLQSGKLGLGDNVVRFRAGRAKHLTVAAGGRTVIEAGGPLQAEFAYRRAGGEVVFTPDTLHYYGRAGEEYVAWKPFGKSPEFTVTDARPDKEGVSRQIAKAIFTGC